MAEIKIELNDEGIRELLNSPGVQNFLLERARSMAAAARANSPDGAIFEATVQTGKTRARASVITANEAARRGEAEDRALTRAIDAARS